MRLDAWWDGTVDRGVGDVRRRKEYIQLTALWILRCIWVLVWLLLVPTYMKRDLLTSIDSR